jgi:hypothetical protein
MITMWIIITVLVLTTTLATYGWWLAYRREQITIIYAKWYSDFIYATVRRIRDVKMEMDIIDHRGSFKADDEVGSTFTALQECIDELDNFIKANLEEGDAKE